MTRVKDHIGQNGWPSCLQAVLLASMLLAAPARAQNGVPEQVNYQGLVYLASGSNAVDGPYAMEFRLYDAPVNGNLLWSEEHAEVQIASGTFSVTLGNGVAIGNEPHDSLADVFKNDSIYIEFKVGADPIIKVRQRFVSTPHAFTAQNAFHAVHGVPPGTVMPFAGGGIPYGWLPCDGTAYSQTGPYADLFAAIGTTWGGNATDFNVPNLGGRTVVGAGMPSAPNNSDSSASGITNQPVGHLRGEESHVLTESELPAHSHSYTDRHWGQTQDILLAEGTGLANDSTTNPTRNSDYTGGGQAHNNLQPLAVVNYIIKW